MGIVSQEGTWTADTFRFDSGESLPGIRLAYRTLGEPRRDGRGRISNAVVLLHGTTRSGDHFLAPHLADELFAPGAVLDVGRWYVVLPDCIGHGRSAKPSDGLGTGFPRYGYRDMARALQLLMTEGLGVRNASLVAGISMGGSLTWTWGCMFPDFARALFPITSHPVAIAGRNLLWRQALIDAIRNDPDFEGGRYMRQPVVWRRVMPFMRVLFDGAESLLRAVPDGGAAARWSAQIFADSMTMDTNDVLYAFEASRDYDPQPELERIQARLLSVNFEDDVILAAELGVMARCIARVRRGRAVLLPVSALSNGHQSQNQPRLWAPLMSEFLQAEGTAEAA
jgi:homoserine O-acetyltransferase/O-succinyltransferase